MSQPHRYQELRDALLGGTLDGAGSRELLALFRSRPDQLDELARSIAIDRLLDLAGGDPAEDAHFSDEVVQRIQTAPQADDFAQSVRHRLKPKAFPFKRWALPMAAALALLATGIWFFQRDTTLARITAQSEVEWTGPSPLATGAELKRGQTISIDGGLIALALPGRGEAVLEGPASFRVLGRKHFILEQGRATFTVTKGGRGLTVDTPHGTVVDLGTAFALDISPESGDLHVIEGQVRFTGRDGGVQTLSRNEALQAGPSGTVTIAAGGDQFVRQMPDRPSSCDTLAFWSCRDGRGGSAAASGTVTDPLVFKSATKHGALPQWSSQAGRSGIRFDGEHSYAQTTWRGLAGDTPRTVALRVRVPASWTPEDGGSLVSWGRTGWTPDDLGTLFELTLNRDPAKGPLGAPHLDTSGATATAAIDLRDNQWHHLAVTTYQHDDATSPTQILFYLDGHLVSSSSRVLPRLDTITPGGRHSVIVGRSVQSMISTQPPASDFFPGTMSEILICSDAMSAREIRELMTTGAP